MKVIVTGSTGFVGKELCKRLKIRGAEVIEYSKGQGKDVLDREMLDKECKGCDFFVHLAAELDEKKGIQELRKVNVEGTRNCLDAAVKAKMKKFLYLGSTGVYGSFKGQAAEELEKRPETAYESSKSEAEELVLQYQELIPVVVARSALVLGPNEYWKEIAGAIAKGFPIIGSGKNKWQIVYYKDLADALVMLLYDPNAEFEVFNIAEEPEQARDLNGLVELFRQEMKVGKKAGHVPGFLGISMLKLKALAGGKKQGVISPEYVKRLLKNRDYSIDKIKKLGWKPKYSTEQAVKETVKELGLGKNAVKD